MSFSNLKINLLFFVKLCLHIQHESPKMARGSKICLTFHPLCCKPHCQYVTGLLQRIVEDGAWGTLYSIKSCILSQYLLKNIRSVFKLIKQLSSLSKVIRGFNLPSPACVRYIHTRVLLRISWATLVICCTCKYLDKTISQYSGQLWGGLKSIQRNSMETFYPYFSIISLCFWHRS